MPRRPRHEVFDVTYRLLEQLIVVFYCGLGEADPCVELMHNLSQWLEVDDRLDVVSVSIPVQHVENTGLGRAIKLEVWRPSAFHCRLEGHLGLLPELQVQGEIGGLGLRDITVTHGIELVRRAIGESDARSPSDAFGERIGRGI